MVSFGRHGANVEVEMGEQGHQITGTLLNLKHSGNDVAVHYIMCYTLSEV